MSKLDASIWSGDKISYLVHVRAILVHHDHLGGGVDYKIRKACIYEEWEGPKWFNCISNDNYLKWIRADIGIVPEIR